ncbi:hypothetical protein [Candidatus Coxiella mudrowiae]|uniref:hypothetical protein n=1 Tax=Candidatus Coxiella mudrowiae TaxID=2054173 RepID=UPI001FD2697B|nr:hypothetical protein [Candidatus Coxiella mudrowiae]
MTAFEIIPFILFLVVIGTAIAERINIPYPLVLVITGLLVGFIPRILNWGTLPALLYCLYFYYLFYSPRPG